MSHRTVARWAIAAGVVGLLANALLVAFYALEVGRAPVGPVSLGTMNDAVGAIGSAVMIPVALAMGPWWLRALGGLATAVLTVAGPLLVFQVLSFEDQVPIALAGFWGLALWMVLVARCLPAGVARLGRWAGGAVAVAMPVVGLALLLPSMSWEQLAVIVLAGVPGLVGWLGIPIWFLRLGRALQPHPAAAL